MQVWDANKYQEHAAFVPELGTPVLDLLAPIAGERILDLGCGDGTLTMRLMQSGVSVVGVTLPRKWWPLPVRTVLMHV